jgi:hypothetical protein
MLPSENRSAGMRKEKEERWNCKKIRKRGDMKERRKGEGTLNRIGWRSKGIRGHDVLCKTSI